MFNKNQVKTKKKKKIAKKKNPKLFLLSSHDHHHHLKVKFLLFFFCTKISLIFSVSLILANFISIFSNWLQAFIHSLLLLAIYVINISSMAKRKSLEIHNLKRKISNGKLIFKDFGEKILSRTVTKNIFLFTLITLPSLINSMLASLPKFIVFWFFLFGLVSVLRGHITY